MGTDKERTRISRIITNQVEKAASKSLRKLRKFLSIAVSFLPIAVSASVDLSSNRGTVILVVGAAGEAEYGSNFVQQASLWQKACEQGNLHQRSEERRVGKECRSRWSP